MNLIKKIGQKNIVIVSVALFGIGFYLLGSSQSIPTDTPVIAQENKPSAIEDKANISKSTSELVQESAQRVQANTQNKQMEYPNVTPKKLEKPFSPTLEGTDIDGQLKVGDDGQLIVNIEVKDFFDYFLSATAEVSPELALDELLRVASESLPPENFFQVQELLNNYLAYKEAAISLMSRPMLPQDQQTRDYQLQVMEEGLTELRMLRRQHMSESQVEAFFGLEEAYEDYTIATVKVQFDETISEEQKASMIQYQRSLLPEQIRQTETTIASDNERNLSIQEALTSNDEDTLVEQLDAHNYSDEQKEEILAYKNSQVEFEHRYQEYITEKKTRLSNIKNDAEKEKILSSLQSEYFFTEQELTQAKVKDLSS